MTIYTFYIDSRPEFVTHVPCFSGDPVRWCTGAPLAVLGFAESAQGHSKLVQVVQASTTLPRRCRQAPGSTEGAGWLPVLPRRCRQVLLSPEGAGRCLRSRRCSNEQVSRPDIAGVVTKWCRLAPRSPEGAGWLQAP